MALAASSIRLLATAGLVAAGVMLAAGARAAGDDWTGAMAREHDGDAPVASEAAQTAPDGSVLADEVVYGRTGQAPLRGFHARPEGATGSPGIVVIHEWWGLNDNVRAMARRLAAEGYSVLAVDLYDGQVAETPEGARRLMQGALAREGDAIANVRAALAWLERERAAPRVATLGWCFGGGISLEAALALGDALDAAVVYYGRVVTDPGRLAALEAPLLGLFGAEDEGIPVRSVREFESALSALGKEARIRVYEGAGHAFANPSGTRYRPEAARDAWREALAFLDARLRPDAAGAP